MTRPAISERLAEFFDSYRAVFERLDAAAIADHFAYPCHITSDGNQVQLTAIAGREEWRQQIEGLVATYRRIDVRSAEIVSMSVTELSPRLVQAAVDWRLRDSSGAALYGFHALYTLADANGEMRIAAIAHDEIPRIQELLSRRGAER